MRRGNPLLVTPNLDSLVERGMTFTHCYTMGSMIGAVCTPRKVRDVLYTAYRDCQRSIRDERRKLIRCPLVDRTQLFDLSNDPHELVNLVDKSPLMVANPKPAAWTPPARGDKPARKRKKKAQ